MLCPLNNKVRTRLKCTVVTFTSRDTERTVVSSTYFVISDIECKSVYNNRSRHRVANFDKPFKVIQKVKLPCNNTLGYTITEQLVEQDVVI